MKNVKLCRQNNVRVLKYCTKYAIALTDEVILVSETRQMNDRLFGCVKRDSSLLGSDL